MVEDLGGRTLGGFHLHDLLGAGAHGSVWRATQLRLDREVAVKVLDPVVARNPMTVRRFEREGRAAASLDHPNVVPVYEAGEADGFVYLAMRLVGGETLEHRAARTGPLSPEAVVELLAPVAEALEHAHGRGLVHRDVKPSNILIEADRVYLTDFGIAASVRELGGYTTGALGTAEYMAPEQAQGTHVDRRADVYGLGCVAHFLMEGRPPFGGDDLVATLLAHSSEPVPSVGDERRDAFYAAALAKNPDDRFQSATELVEGLASPEPVATPSGAEAVEARDRGRWLAMVMVLVALFVGFVGVGRGGGGTDTAPETVESAADAAAGAEIAEGSGEDPADGAESGPGVADGAATTTVAADPVPLVGGEVDVALVRSLDSINPHKDRLAEATTTAHVLPPLMVLADDWTLQPWLADAPPEIVSTDPFRTRWTLRSDAVWDDGSPITSTDVARTLDYILDPTVGAEATVLYEGVELVVVDDRTFELSFGALTEAHEALFSTLHPVIKAEAYDDHLAAGNDPATFLEDEIAFSGGPFRVAGYDAGQRVTLVRNDAWWGEPPPLDRITLRRFDASEDQIDALASGDVDIAYLEAASAADRGDVEAIDGVTVDAGVADRRLRLDMNTAVGPTAEVGVRMAIATAIDRSDIGEAATTAITREPPRVLQTLVWPAAHPANTEPFATIEVDSTAAQALLQEAGWELGEQGARFMDGEVLELRLIFDRFNSLLGQSVAQNIVVALDEVGVRVVAEVLGAEQASLAKATGDYGLAVSTALADPDPVPSQLRWHSRECPETFGVSGCESTTGANIVGLVAAEIDALLDTAATLTGEERVVAYQQFDALLAEVLPSVPLFEIPVLVAFDDDLVGVAVDGHRHGPLANMDEWARLAVAGS